MSHLTSFFSIWRQAGGLNSPDPGKRQATIDALGSIGGPQAIRKISLALDDSDSAVARKAAETLARMRAPDALDALGRALKKALADCASPALAGENELSQDLWLDHLVQQLSVFGPPAAPLLMDVLRNREVELKNRPHVQSGSGVARAAESLGRMAYAGAAAALVDCLNDPIESVRSGSARALGSLHAAGGVDPLTRALRDKGASVRQSAGEALGAIGDKKAVGALEAILKDESTLVRQAAAAALAQLGWQPQGKDLLAWSLAARGEYARSAEQGARSLRPLMAALWSAYGIDSSRSNDAQGMANYLKKVMTKEEPALLPDKGLMQAIVESLLAAMATPDESFEVRDLKMLMTLPDLRVRSSGKSTQASDDVSDIPCDALRTQAGELCRKASE